MAIKTYLLKITLKVTGLNAWAKGHRMAKKDIKTRPVYMLSIIDPLQV